MVKARGTYAKSRREGRFFGRRVNCEHVPFLPVRVVTQLLSDPRKIPYLLVWTSPRDHGIKEAVRLTRHQEVEGLGGLDWADAVEVKRSDGTRNFIRTCLQPLPHNRGSVRFLICPYCSCRRLGLYGWEPRGDFTSSAVRSSWGCRQCNALRYESEGGARVLRGHGISALLINLCGGPHLSARGVPWCPAVFISPQEAAEAGLFALK